MIVDTYMLSFYLIQNLSIFLYLHCSCLIVVRILLQEVVNTLLILLFESSSQFFLFFLLFMRLTVDDVLVEAWDARPSLDGARSSIQNLLIIVEVASNMRVLRSILDLLNHLRRQVRIKYLPVSVLDALHQEFTRDVIHVFFFKLLLDFWIVGAFIVLGTIVCLLVRIYFIFDRLKESNLRHVDLRANSNTLITSAVSHIL